MDEKTVLARLGGWFERQKRVLPWRDEPTPYRVWISEIMLQQTQVATVIPYFERFVSRFPSVESLAQASEDEVLLHWAGLGYYSRARNLYRGAQRVVARGLPRSRDEWLEIPGVGPYTAGAIASISADQVEPILDGNVERVLSRVRRVGRQKGDAPYKARLWRLARLFVERAAAEGVRPSVLNQAMMELGATVCTPRKPRCPVCPLAERCRALQAGETEAFPPRKAPKQWLAVREHLHCLIDARGRVLVRRRSVGEWRQGLWDLPDESPAANAWTKLGDLETRHVVTRHKIQRRTEVWVRGWNASESDAEASIRATGETRWISPQEPEVAVGSALKRVLQEIRERFPEAPV